MTDLQIDLAAEIAAIRAHRAGANTLRTHRLAPEVSPYTIRSRLNLTQEDFATLMGVSKRTLEQWEQGRRNPQGAALTLLKIANQHPDVFLSLR